MTPIDTMYQELENIFDQIIINSLSRRDKDTPLKFTEVMSLIPIPEDLYSELLSFCENANITDTNKFIRAFMVSLCSAGLTQKVMSLIPEQIEKEKLN